MHSPYHWYWAKLLGDEPTARDRFDRGVKAFMFGPFNLIDEFGANHTAAKEKVGPYLAHCGAIVQTCYQLG
jgi:hypothetical protein